MQISGPTGAFIVILAGITAEHGIAGLQVATLMAGIILLILGLTRMGRLIRFIPAPVIVGFTAGIGVIIWVGQWAPFFGLPTAQGEHFHEKIGALFASLPHFHMATTAMAVGSLVLVTLGPRLPGLARVPGPLIALVIGTSLQSYFYFDGVATIGSAFGGIPRGLPTFAIPEFDLGQAITLIGPAFTIAMLGAIESLLSAVVADGMAGTRHDSNQELVGQGIANIAAPMFGGFAATGAIARTATNIRNGGTSPLSGVVHSITLLLIILVLAPLAVNIPLATLAAVLFVVAWNMSQVRQFVQMARQAPRADVAILLVTFLLTVFADLVVAVNIGVILATLQFMRRMASSVEISQASEQEMHSAFGSTDKPLPEGVMVYTIDGPIFYGVADNFEQVLAATHTDPTVLIIRMRWVPFVDITGIHALQNAITALQKRNVVVKICGANALVTGKLQRAGLIDTVGANNCFANLEQTLASLAPQEPLPA